MIRLLGVMAEDYSRSLSENVKWGIQKMFESGRVNGGGRMLGYRWKGCKPYIIPEEAKIVQQNLGRKTGDINTILRCVSSGYFSR